MPVIESASAVYLGNEGWELRVRWSSGSSTFSSSYSCVNLTEVVRQLEQLCSSPDTIIDTQEIRVRAVMGQVVPLKLPEFVNLDEDGEKIAIDSRGSAIPPTRDNCGFCDGTGERAGEECGCLYQGEFTCEWYHFTHIKPTAR